MQKTFNTVNTITKDMGKKKNKQTEITQLIEIKNILEGTNCRITEAEEQISELEDRFVEITAEEQNKGKRMEKIEDSLRDLWDNIKCTSIQLMGLPEEEEEKEKKNKGVENIFEEIAVENIPNMGKEIISKVQEGQKVP